MQPTIDQTRSDPHSISPVRETPTSEVETKEVEKQTKGGKNEPSETRHHRFKNGSKDQVSTTTTTRRYQIRAGGLVAYIRRTHFPTVAVLVHLLCGECLSYTPTPTAHTPAPSMSSKEVICFTCNKRIEGQVLTALDKTYHPEHFICEKCKKPICDNKFRTHDGRAYCEEDYNRLFVAHCHGCGEAIGGKFISALGHDWHEEHFLCNWCKSKLVGQTFMEHAGQPICQKCFKDNVANKCKKCGLGIMERTIIALDANWHPDCFVCKQCKKPITEKSFQVVDGLPKCGQCP